MQQKRLLRILLPLRFQTSYPLIGNISLGIRRPDVKIGLNLLLFPDLKFSVIYYLMQSNKNLLSPSHCKGHQDLGE